MEKNILVIGGAGFIGSHLCDELVKNNRVICLDNFLTGSEQNIEQLLANPNFEFVRHDIAQPFDFSEGDVGLKKFKAAWTGVQEIYFMATPTAFGDVEKYPVETLQVNAVGLRNALDLAVKYGARFCYVSGDAVYGEPVDGILRVKENTRGVVVQTDPHATAAVALRFGEALVTAYRRYRKLDVRIARVFNTFGPRMRLDDTRLVAEFTRLALEGKQITVYGGSETLGSYCYVSDTVKALVKVMDQGDEQPVNIGQEQPVKLIDLAREVISLVGSSSEIVVLPNFPDGYHAQLQPDITRAKDDLSWFPVTLLRDGLTHTIEDLRASKGLVAV